MVQEIDADGNGVIDFQEFLTVMTKRRLATTSVAELRIAFGMSSLEFRPPPPLPLK